MCRSYIAVHYWTCFSIQDACDIDPWCNRISRAEGSLAVAVRMTFGRRRSSSSLTVNLQSPFISTFLNWPWHPSSCTSCIILQWTRSHLCEHIFSSHALTLNILNDLQVSSQNTSKPVKVKSIVIHGHNQMVAFAALLERTSHLRCVRNMLAAYKGCHVGDTEGPYKGRGGEFRGFERGRRPNRKYITYIDRKSVV